MNKNEDLDYIRESRILTAIIAFPGMVVVLVIVFIFDISRNTSTVMIVIYSVFTVILNNSVCNVLESDSKTKFSGFVMKVYNLIWGDETHKE